jgi:hypothetical protein
MFPCPLIIVVTFGFNCKFTANLGDIKSRMNLRNSCYLSMCNLSTSLLYENVVFILYEIVIFAGMKLGLPQSLRAY